MFQAEIDRLELRQKEEIMEVTTSWEEKGVEKATQTIALNLLQENIPLETIARTTGLSIAQLQALQTQVKPN